MKENYTYPAIVSSEEDGTLTIRFPTLGGAETYADSEEELIEAGQELLALTLIDCLDSNQPVPEEEADLTAGEGEKLVYIHVWLPYFRSRTHEVYVKKTLTIPAWLDVLAKQNEINFSAVLTEALKKKLELE